MQQIYEVKVITLTRGGLADEKIRSNNEPQEVGRSEQVSALFMIEPRCTERYARWCERSAAQLMGSLLLDFGQMTMLPGTICCCRFVRAVIYCLHKPKLHFK